MRQGVELAQFWRRGRALQALRDFDVASNGRAIAFPPSMRHVCKTRGCRSWSVKLMALTFDIFIVFLLIVGSVWIMTHLNHNMIQMERLMQMQR
jgi:hypothetical protein